MAYCTFQSLINICMNKNNDYRVYKVDSITEMPRAVSLLLCLIQFSLKVKENAMQPSTCVQ